MTQNFVGESLARSIAKRAVIPGLQQSRLNEVVAIASRDQAKARKRQRN